MKSICQAEFKLPVSSDNNMIRTQAILPRT